MSDANRFHEMLSDIMEVARVQGNQLTMEDVKSLFGDIDLTDEQYDHIYAYLAANNIKIKGFIESSSVYREALQQDKLREEFKSTEAMEDTISDQSMDDPSNTLQEEDSVYLKMYLEDLDAIEDCTFEEELELIQQILKGDPYAKQRFVEGSLRNIVNVAKEYRNQGTTLEDLIQEGNIGLMNSLEHLSDLFDEVEKEEVLNQGYDKNVDSKIVALRYKIYDDIRNFMEVAIKEQSESNRFENSIVDKTNFLNFAANGLAEELGRDADIHELAEFTKLSEDEIKDILSISGDAVKVNSHHHHRKDE